jgi:hypothetical protein
MITPLPPSPYRYPIKCFVGKKSDGWRVTGHRWGDVPYYVGTFNDWHRAIITAHDHVKVGGLAWPTSSVVK